MKTTHFKAVFKLRLLLARREFLSIFSGVVFPFFMVGFAVAIAAAIPTIEFPSVTVKRPLVSAANLPYENGLLKLGLVVDESLQASWSTSFSALSAATPNVSFTTFQSIDSFKSNGKQDLGYTILLEGSQANAGYGLLNGLISQKSNLLIGTNLPAPFIFPQVATFVTGQLVDIAAQIVPSFIVNALTFTVLNVAEARVKENENGVVTSMAGYVIPMILYGFVVVPAGYCISFCFKKPTSVGTVGASIQTLVVFVPYFIVQFITKTVSRGASIGFTALAPSFGLYRIITVNALSVQTGKPYTLADVFNINNEILPLMLVFVIQFIVYSLLAILLFHLQRNNITFLEFLSRKQTANMRAKAAEASQDLEATLADDSSFPLDSQLNSEIEYLRTHSSNDAFDDDRMQMVVEGVGKVVNSNASGSKRKNLVILNDLWFGVRKGECFGFLGPNGAGKSTTMKILTGLETLTTGRVRFSADSKDVLTATSIPKWKLTPYEHLVLYAAIREIPDVSRAAMEALETVGIKKHGARVQTLSGGNKRRLMLAIATIGSPKLIFLDEPTTGVDIAIRRSIWTAIEGFKKTSAVILTSHSMEEVDALSDRIGILVNGKLRCLGTSQYLKSTHGAGYVVTLRTDTEANAIKSQKWLTDKLNALGHLTRCTRMIGCTVVFEVSSTDHSVKHSVGLLEDVFGVLRKKEEVGVNDFSVAQTTLQQVFIDFAKRQKELKSF
ncbi:P-loop containing nucleoside triphosphate hydrolase protein [Rhizoclosmatium globosum]|uniref:p-loop containing nucleoside triphosphate hydrolase protein n=1 Tax=Rhizoclosmatium globosum TaxID=329046 RepID=A0A1Y2BTQ9_9FUNG|nr:P-loop containing nucleoside triphosphate hydrolase protein [Rhizoclosmatium globosum]|eukprot:ORY38131.1 P-loop containing nucleoside triphosphate hydrolase protein [Rhizoclosmatium globosum]